jgi:stress-induced morphogen
MIPSQQILEKLKEAFPGGEIGITDLTGGMDHYQVVIEWTGFAGMNAVARHRMVHAALREELRGPIHALTLELREKPLS